MCINCISEYVLVIKNNQVLINIIHCGHKSDFCVSTVANFFTTAELRVKTVFDLIVKYIRMLLPNTFVEYT